MLPSSGELSKARALKLETGDTTSALIEFESGATGTLAGTWEVVMHSWAMFSDS